MNVAMKKFVSDDVWRVGVLAIVVLCGCSGPKDTPAPSTNTQQSDLALLTRSGCANTSSMRANLDAALRRMGRSVEYVVIDLDTVATDDLRRGYGTPTVLYKGRDLFGMPEPARGDPEAA